MTTLESYKNLLGPEVIDQLFDLAKHLKGKNIVHVNSTKEGGGVAEILHMMVPLTNEIGIKTTWEIIKGEKDFYDCTKHFHNMLQQRQHLAIPKNLLQAYEETTAKNAEELKEVLQNADIVIIHDPQPLHLINYFPNRKGKWIWRCHIDVSNPSRELWKFLYKTIQKYDASIFSIEDFVHPLPHPCFLIPPSIDPLSEKNIDLDSDEVERILSTYHIDPKRPIVLQVSRFDYFKDPIGVIEAFRLAKKLNPKLQLVLAGGSASDDPEGEAVLAKVLEAAKDDPNIFVLSLPPDFHRVINGLQRGATIVLQKSIKEGFGLTVTEALWKIKPVIGGNTGGIRLQVINHQTGFLVNTPEGAALRIRYLLQNVEMQKEFGLNGKRLVKENFLITRHLRDYLTVMMSLFLPKGDRIDLSRQAKLTSGL